MNKLITGIAIIGLLASCSEHKKGDFQLKGTLSNAKGEMLYFEKLTGQQPVVLDSVEVDESGNFEFSNYIPKIGFYRIKVNDSNFAMLILDSADKVTVTGNIADLGNSYKVEGSPETKLFLEFNDLRKSISARVDSLSQVFQNQATLLGLDRLQQTNPELAYKISDSLSKTLEGPYKAIMDAANERIADKIKSNISMFTSIIAIQGLDPEKYSDLFKQLDENLTKKYPNSQDVLMLHSMVSKSSALAIGMEAPEINLPDINGKPLALSAFRGKIVLVDFWASWCAPCRKEMPNVINAYKKFKDKGFEIYGVSLDQSKDKWIDAIAKDGITWPQVSDLKYWESDAAKLYNIQSIPFTVLIDKEGRIIAKNLRGEELEAKLAEVLN